MEHGGEGIFEDIWLVSFFVVILPNYNCQSSTPNSSHVTVASCCIFAFLTSNRRFVKVLRKSCTRVYCHPENINQPENIALAVMSCGDSHKCHWVVGQQTGATIIKTGTLWECVQSLE